MTACLQFDGQCYKDMSVRMIRKFVINLLGHIEVLVDAAVGEFKLQHRALELISG